MEHLCHALPFPQVQVSVWKIRQNILRARGGRRLQGSHFLDTAGQFPVSTRSSVTAGTGLSQAQGK